MGLFHRHKSEEYTIIKKSKLFDKRYYLETYPDVRAAKVDPIEHYLNHGWREGRNPSENFQTDFYLSNYISDFSRDICPLVHYEKYGKKMGFPTISPIATELKFPPECQEFSETFSHDKKPGRVAIFAMFNAHGIIPQATLYYLKELKKVVNNIVLIGDHPILATEVKKIKDIVSHCLFVRHNEYDFGSYKRGFMWAKSNGLLDNCTELVFCNDSCYGPVYPFNEMFDTMATKPIDFWGVCANIDFGYHLQSYFLVFRTNVFNSDAFINFVSSIKHQENVHGVIIQYEVTFTRALQDAGFSCDSYIPYDITRTEQPYKTNSNLTTFPIWLMNNRCPLVKVKALNKTNSNFEGIYKTFNHLATQNKILADYINQDSNNHFFPTFSVIVPTYNRASLIVKTLHSILGQLYQNFEIIVVDDGSTDNTSELIHAHFAPEIECEKIRYFHIKNSGVCKARNYALAQAKNEWIAYVDSDNLLFPDFLSTFVKNITEKNKKIRTFYCQCQTMSGHVLGGAFDYLKLLNANYIDLGMVVHHISLYHELGGFDENMTRLVDWDLIARYTRDYPPLYIDKVCMLYNDIDDRKRISNTADYDANLAYFRNKHCNKKDPSILT